ncbi:hypothetical protein GCM10009764_60840 [Nocardia ninae]|uniref:Uncharacterized protein n=1 Tax=Nocardia ninae NBRC 108245 TaxID=1210091 RepID=A0A511MQN5_9NOCA|nr:hypothetical protein NN4_74220 [Nocardia ninae NBRC 108245]
MRCTVERGRPVRSDSPSRVSVGVAPSKASSINVIRSIMETGGWDGRAGTGADPAHNSPDSGGVTASTAMAHLHCVLA